MKKSRIILLSLAACALLAVLFHSAILRAAGSYLVRADAPRSADIAVVLAGDFSGNRILKAAELVRQGYAPQAIVDGPSGNYGFYESDLAIPFAEKKGFPAAYFIALPMLAHSTKEEAETVLPELRKRRVHTVLLVTSDYHTRRAGRIYRALAPGLDFVVVAAPDQFFTAGAWWKNREGRKTFAIEWMKTVAEWFGL